MTQSPRRKFLKMTGISLAAASLSTASSTLMATFKPSSQTVPVASVNDLPSCDITIYRQQMLCKESITLMNLTGETVRLDGIQPVGLEQVNKRLLVKVNATTDGSVVLEPGARVSFEVQANSLGSVDEKLQIPNVLSGHLKLNSDHPAFNGVIPVTVFDTQIA